MSHPWQFYAKVSALCFLVRPSNSTFHTLPTAARGAARMVQPLSCYHRQRVALPHRGAHLFMRVVMGAIPQYLDQEWLQ